MSVPSPNNRSICDCMGFQRAVEMEISAAVV